MYGCHGFGFGLGIVGLFLLFGALRHRRHHYHYAYGPYGYDGRPPFDDPECHARGYGGHFGHGRGFRGGRLRRLFERLDTAPGQEKAIRAIFDDLRTHMKAAKGSSDAELLKTFHTEITQAYERAVETLDDKQRKLLAELIAGRF